MQVQWERKNVTSKTHVRSSSGSSKLTYSWRSSGSGGAMPSHSMSAPLPSCVMSAVGETRFRRVGRRARHGLRVLTTAAPWREQVRCLRHGPSPTAVPLHDARYPSTPWRPLPSGDGPCCNVCTWRGEAFLGDRHVEAQLCPACGSSARDRFSFYCFISRTPPSRRLRVTETSPPLHATYRRGPGHRVPLPGTGVHPSA